MQNNHNFEELIKLFLSSKDGQRVILTLSKDGFKLRFTDELDLLLGLEDNDFAVPALADFLTAELAQDFCQLFFSGQTLIELQQLCKKDATASPFLQQLEKLDYYKNWQHFLLQQAAAFLTAWSTDNKIPIEKIETEKDCCESLFCTTTILWEFADTKKFLARVESWPLWIKNLQDVKKLENGWSLQTVNTDFLLIPNNKKNENNIFEYKLSHSKNTSPAHLFFTTLKNINATDVLVTLQIPPEWKNAEVKSFFQDLSRGLKRLTERIRNPKDFSNEK